MPTVLGDRQVVGGHGGQQGRGVLVDPDVGERAEERQVRRQLRLVAYLQPATQLNGGAAAELHVGAGELHVEAVDVGREGELRHDQVAHQLLIDGDRDVVRRQQGLAALEPQGDGPQALDLAFDHDTLRAKIAGAVVATAAGARDCHAAGDQQHERRAVPGPGYCTFRHVMRDTWPPAAAAGCRYIRSPSNS